ncbi:cupin domain-containing protein [Nocardia sp. NPDC088792]|uniref:cupin domain-containing protein n=1 Tax=Nocardia sp. NPDC088792 TaxID=3364332 RepID=UPI003800B989
MSGTLRRLLGGTVAAAAVAVSLTSATLPAAATPNVGVSAQPMSTATVDDVHIAPDGPVDIQFTVLTVDPGGSVGWHWHSGDVLVNIADGTATRYEADDPRCAPASFGRGQGWVEHPHHVHTVHNETDKPLILDVVLITPSGQPSGVSAPDPGNCRF